MLLIMETLWTLNQLQCCPIAVQIDFQKKKKNSNNKVWLLRENSEFGKNTFDSFFSFPNFKLEKSESHRRRQNFGAEEKSFSSTKFLNIFKPPGCQVCL